MEKLILFRQSVDSLNDVEFQECLKLTGRETLTALLFMALHYQIIDNKLDNVEALNCIIKNIKDSRTKQQGNENSDNQQDSDADNANEQKQNIEIKIDDVPYVLLSEISSFLQFDDKIRFEQTNSSIFIALNSCKLALYSLSPNNFFKLIKYGSKSNNNNKKYISKIKIFNSLTIECATTAVFGRGQEKETMVKHEFNHLELFKNIKTLKIEYNATCKLQCVLSHLFQTNLPNLQTLRIIGGEFHLDAPNPFGFIMDRFAGHPNLQFVEVTCWMTKHITINSCYYHWVSLLKGIAIHNLYDDGVENEMMTNIYRSSGDNLESLHKGTSAITKEIDGKLSKLKEICLASCHFDGDIQILLQQNMNALERIHFTEFIVERRFRELTQLLMIKSVKYIGLNVANVKSLQKRTMNVLVKSLQNIYTNKATLKIRIDNVHIRNAEEIADFMTKSKELINILNTKCLDWMFIAYNWKVIGVGDLNLLMAEAMSKYDVTVNTSTSFCNKWYTSATYYNFVIKNRKCAINGYHEPWIMTCQCCQQHPLKL